MFDMSVHVSGGHGDGVGETPAQPPSGLVPVLEDNMNATQTLLTRFIQLGGQSTSFLLRDDFYLSCQRAQTEVRNFTILWGPFLTEIVMVQCIALRSQMDLMRVKLRDSVAEKESLHTALVAAQTRADRLQSETVLAMQARAAVRKREAEQQKGEQQQEPKEEESSSEEPQRKLPSSPEVSGLGQPNWWEFFFVLSDIFPPSLLLFGFF
jgi:E3 ubiquitin-protein ligase BRE1